MSENFEIAITIFLTGIVVVFVVLVLLICIIMAYGAIVHNAQIKNEEKKKQKEMANKKQTEPVEVIKQVEYKDAVTEDSISGEVVAAISAAVDFLYGEENTTVKSIKKRPKARSAWSTAGLIENTRPF